MNRRARGMQQHRHSSCTVVYLSFHPMAKWCMNALKGLACRKRMAETSSPAATCKQGAALTSPARHACGCARPSRACFGHRSSKPLCDGSKTKVHSGTSTAPAALSHSQTHLGRTCARTRIQTQSHFIEHQQKRPDGNVVKWPIHNGGPNLRRVPFFLALSVLLQCPHVRTNIKYGTVFACAEGGMKGKLKASVAPAR